MPAPARLDAGLCVFGLTYACGFTWAGTAKANPRPLDLFALIDLAASRGLAGIEFPPDRMLPDRSPAALARVRAAAEAQDLRIVIAGSRVEREHLAEQVRLAGELGAATVRCTLSPLLCGDRRPLGTGVAARHAWEAHLAGCARELAAVLPGAEAAGVAVALENHQDATSADLLALCRRFDSPALGVTLDTGNPLAVMEEPLAFAARVAPYLRHVHLKDYRIHPAPGGARLVRCALGDGVIDFAGLFRILDAQPRPISRSLEMAALEARLIPFLEPSWWAGFPPRPAGSVTAALAVFWQHARPPGEEWRTPYEREEDGGALLAREWEEFEASVAYLTRLRSGSE